jgi:TolA-binding protein
MSIGKGVALAFWAALLCAAGCVTKGEGEKIWAEIRAIQAQNNEILRSLNENKTKLVSLMRTADQKIGDLGKKIEQAENILRRSNVDFFQQLQQLQAEVSKASGRIEQVERNTDVLKRDLDGFREEANRKISEAKDAVAKATAPPAPPQSALPSDPQAAYAQASQALAQGNHDRAVQLYLELLKQFPKHPQMEDIQFGLAEAYFAKKEYKQALAEYSRFYQDFGGSARAAEALFKVAQCYQSLGDYQTAHLSLTVITKKFKDSTFARQAKTIMKQLKKKM